VLLGYPKALVFSLDGKEIREIAYEDMAPMQIVRRFVNHSETSLEELKESLPSSGRTPSKTRHDLAQVSGLYSTAFVTARHCRS
jgi:hypothetical protein